MAKQQESYQSIEAFADLHQVSLAKLEGMKAAQGWRAGKQVTEQEFFQAFTAFLQAPADNRGPDQDQEAKG